MILSTHIYYGDNPSNYSLSSAYSVDFAAIPSPGDRVDLIGMGDDRYNGDWVVMRVSHRAIARSEDEPLASRTPSVMVILRRFRSLDDFSS